MHRMQRKGEKANRRINEKVSKHILILQRQPK